MQVDSKKSVSDRHLLKEYLLYFVISVFVVGISIFALFIDVPWDLYMRWFALLAATGVLFGQFIVSSRPLWRRRLFWVFTIVLLSIHCAFNVLILLKGRSGINSVWVFLIDAVLLFFVRDFYFKQAGR